MRSRPWAPRGHGIRENPESEPGTPPETLFETYGGPVRRTRREKGSDPAFLIENLGYDAGADRATTLANREPKAFLHREGGRTVGAGVVSKILD